MFEPKEGRYARLSSTNFRFDVHGGDDRRGAGAGAPSSDIAENSLFRNLSGLLAGDIRERFYQICREAVCAGTERASNGHFARRG